MGQDYEIKILYTPIQLLKATHEIMYKQKLLEKQREKSKGLIRKIIDSLR